jgi:hypothetical protein
MDRPGISASGRNGSLANGGLQASTFQCRLSGDESEGSAVATRPEAEGREFGPDAAKRTSTSSLLVMLSPLDCLSFDRADEWRIDLRFHRPCVERS